MVQGFGLPGSGFSVLRSAFRVPWSWFKVQGLEFRVKGLIHGSRLRVYSVGFMGLGLEYFLSSDAENNKTARTSIWSWRSCKTTLKS